MKTIKFAITVLVLLAFASSCRDTKKEDAIIDAKIDSIETIEYQIDETVQEVEKKTEEVEDALMQLDSI